MTDKIIIDQTRLQSFIEACINTFLGFVITLACVPFIYPIFGHSFTFTQNLGITAIFTVISIIRGYAVRRWANNRIKMTAIRLSKGYK